MTFVVVGLCAALLSVPEPGAEELRAVIRVTAFTSVVPFVLAFTASAIHRLWPGGASRWLVANRRYLGLSFAVSHLAHGLAIVALARRMPEFVATLDSGTLVGGLLGFAMIALMGATSNDASMRALGRGWSVLHTVGIYYLWFIFLFTYIGPAAHSPFHAAMTVLLGGAWMLRLAARRAESATRATVPARP